jgi:hypothetical protein
MSQIKENRDKFRIYVRDVRALKQNIADASVDDLIELVDRADALLDIAEQHGYESFGQSRVLSYASLARVFENRETLLQQAQEKFEVGRVFYQAETLDQLDQATESRRKKLMDAGVLRVENVSPEVRPNSHQPQPKSDFKSWREREARSGGFTLNKPHGRTKKTVSLSPETNIAVTMSGVDISYDFKANTPEPVEAKPEKTAYTYAAEYEIHAPSKLEEVAEEEQSPALETEIAPEQAEEADQDTHTNEGPESEGTESTEQMMGDIKGFVDLYTAHGETMLVKLSADALKGETKGIALFAEASKEYLDFIHAHKDDPRVSEMFESMGMRRDNVVAILEKINEISEELKAYAAAVQDGQKPIGLPLMNAAIFDAFVTDEYVQDLEDGIKQAVADDNRDALESYDVVLDELVHVSEERFLALVNENVKNGFSTFELIEQAKNLYARIFGLSGMVQSSLDISHVDKLQEEILIKVEERKAEPELDVEKNEAEFEVPTAPAEEELTEDEAIVLKEEPIAPAEEEFVMPDMEILIEQAAQDTSTYSLVDAKVRPKPQKIKTVDEFMVRLKAYAAYSQNGHVLHTLGHETAQGQRKLLTYCDQEVAHLERFFNKNKKNKNLIAKLGELGEHGLGNIDDLAQALEKERQEIEARKGWVNDVKANKKMPIGGPIFNAFDFIQRVDEDLIKDLNENINTAVQDNDLKSLQKYIGRMDYIAAYGKEASKALSDEIEALKDQISTEENEAKRDEHLKNFSQKLKEQKQCEKMCAALEQLEDSALSVKADIESKMSDDFEQKYVAFGQLIEGKSYAQAIKDRDQTHVEKIKDLAEELLKDLVSHKNKDMVKGSKEALNFKKGKLFFEQHIKNAKTSIGNIKRRKLWDKMSKPFKKPFKGRGSIFGKVQTRDRVEEELSGNDLEAAIDETIAARDGINGLNGTHDLTGGFNDGNEHEGKTSAHHQYMPEGTPEDYVFSPGENRPD